MPVKRSGALRFLPLVFAPAEFLPQLLRNQPVYPFEDVGGFVARGCTGQDLGGGLARQDDCGGHAGVECHADVGIESVAGHDTVIRIEPEQVHYGLEHHRVGLADVHFAFGTGTRLDSGDDRGRVWFPSTTGEGAVAVGVGGNEPGSLVVPDRVKGNLKLPVLECTVVAGDDNVYLLRLFGDPDTSLAQRTLERFLRYREDGSVRVVLEQPSGHGDDGVHYLRRGRLYTETGQLLRVLLGIFGGI